MNPRSIRVRLTLWYLAALSAGLLTLDVATWFAMREMLLANREAAMDGRLAALANFIERESVGQDFAAIREEAREYSSGLPEQHLLRVTLPDGSLLFERPSGAADLLTRRGHFTIRGHEVDLELGAPLDDYYKTLALLRRVMIGLFPGVLALAGFGGWWLAQRGLQPVDRMTSEALAIDAKDLETRLSVPQSGDELQRLAETFNDLLARIRASVRTVMQFTADAAHELRTPVTVIRSASELALRRERTPDGYRQALRTIHEESSQMTELLDQLLTLAQGDAGVLRFELDAVPAGVVVNRCCEVAAALAEAKGVHLACRVPEEDVLVLADESALRRLLLILIDNAIKFTPASKFVFVSMRTDSQNCRIDVVDEGPGVAPELLPLIFDRFFRADAARTRSEGAGLGLAIARAIVRGHGGSIEAFPSSASGMVFRITLPLIGTRQPDLAQAR
jgi:heavy metal sensor kinase